MAISSRFNFVSPGISIQEIDNSQLPAEPINSGPAIIGRLAKGPGLRPVKVSSRSEFVETFGNPELPLADMARVRIIVRVQNLMPTHAFLGSKELSALGTRKRFFASVRAKMQSE